MPDNFEIAYWQVFLLLPLPLLVYILLPPLKVRSASLFLPTYKKAIIYTGQKPRKAALVKKRNIPTWITLHLAWVLMLLALSGPRLVGEPEMKVKTSRNFLIVADISFSMAQKDWILSGKKVRRWDGVKAVMHDFVKKRRGDRMGLIFFGSSAYVQAPFTPDLEIVDQMLDEADVGMAGQMTYLGKAITKGVEMFDRDTMSTKVMLLLTDGVDGGTDIMPMDAANLAKQDSVKIYTVGIGNPGTKGSDLDERTLQDIANATQGQYFRAKDQKRLKEIYIELDKLEPIEYEEEQNRPITHLYSYPLLAAISLMVLMRLVQLIIKLIRMYSKREVQDV
ncbi:MAG: VWA domain-containing protein [Bacteroidales bacterium]